MKVENIHNMVEDIHNIYTHITGRAEGMVTAGGEADFPVMFAEAILDYYKKPWVGLTDEDLQCICDEWQIYNGAWMNVFVGDIEAKLKERNHD
jgi:hypothetical protein